MTVSSLLFRSHSEQAPSCPHLTVSPSRNFPSHHQFSILKITLNCVFSIFLSFVFLPPYIPARFISENIFPSSFFLSIFLITALVIIKNVNCDTTVYTHIPKHKKTICIEVKLDIQQNDKCDSFYLSFSQGAKGLVII